MAAVFAFRGECRHKVDVKGRVSIPADFRRGIISGDPDYLPGGAAAFTIVYGDCRIDHLKCYTEQAIREIDEAIGEMDLASEKRRFLEFFYQIKSFKALLDPTGRFVLPASLKAKAKIKGEVCFAGTGGSFEMWNPEGYDAHCSELEQLCRSDGKVEDPWVLLATEL